MTKGETKPAVVRIGTPIPLDRYEALRSIAKDEDRSLAYVIRRALEAEIEKAAA